MKALKNFEQTIDAFPRKDKITSLLLQVPPENSLEAQLILIKNLTDRGFKVITLSGGRPCKDLISMYEEKKIEMNNIHIIDMICRSQHLNVKDTKFVTHMNSIQSLTEISILLNKIIVPKKTVLFVDSITSMLIYNDERVFTRFLSEVVQKMKTREIHLILLIIKTKNYDNIRSELKYLCDQEMTF
ncbi:hypothetical protein HZC31_06745 [Candidatus Woesearchaeota archaeon]|nr:hypothetical protein [Candidatus Woesearchaeota archaeon]